MEYLMRNGIITVVDRIMTPKDVHILIPGTCEYVTLYGKRNFANLVQLRTFGWEDDPGLPR